MTTAAKKKPAKPAAKQAKPAPAPAAVAAPPAPQSHMQVVWEWLRDHPASTTTEAAEKTSLPLGEVSALFTTLTRRRMVERSERPAALGARFQKVYSCNPKMQGFELLPLDLATLPMAYKKKSAPQVPAQGPPAVPTTASELLDKLSVREAYAVFLELSAMFEEHATAK